MDEFILQASLYAGSKAGAPTAAMPDRRALAAAMLRRNCFGAAFAIQPQNRGCLFVVFVQKIKI